MTSIPANASPNASPPTTVTPVALVKYPEERPPASMGPVASPLARSRVRRIRHGSTGLDRNTAPCGPSAATLILAEGGV